MCVAGSVVVKTSATGEDSAGLRQVYSLLAISACSMAGVATRVALLNVASRHQFFTESSEITVNVLGSFIIGFLAGLAVCKEGLPYTYLGLTVGFCGSLTTFSGWIHAVVFTTHSHWVELVTGLSLPFIAFIAGEDIGNFFIVKSIATDLTAAVDKAIVTVVSLACVLCTVVIAAVGTPGVGNDDLIMCAIGPIGALTRFALSKWLNGKWGFNNFRLGTLVSNIAAVLLTGGLGRCSNEWCGYATVGIAGSLSTVSTWVMDTVTIYRNSKPWAYFYALVSVGIGAVVLLPFDR